MTDILNLEQRVRNEILIGESDFREFKSALEGRPGNKKPRQVKKICADIAEALVAFANTDGGTIIIGVEDDMTISGIPHSEEDIAKMQDAPKRYVFQLQTLPIVHNAKINIDGKTILFLQVDKGVSEIYQLSDGRIMRRDEKRSSVPANIKQLEFDRNEEKSRIYDRQYVDGAVISDLDIPLIKSFAEKYLSGLTPEKYLQQLGLAVYASNGLRLTKAAVLLFSREIQRWHPGSQVRFLRINGEKLLEGENYNAISDEVIYGNIHELILNSWDKMRQFLAYKTELNTDSQFQQRYIYPEQACREALLNAIAHRDYSSTNSIEVHIFNDRMEIKSPGALLSNLTIKDLEMLDNRHESRNVKTAYTLKTTGYMREIGEGIKRIFHSMQEEGLQKPKLYSNRVWFTVTLFNKSIFNSIQRAFIDLFSNYDLSIRQMKILVTGMNGKELSPEDIYNAMNTRDRNTYDREVTSLRKQKLLSEIRSNSSASFMSKQKGISKQKIARFKVNRQIIK